MNWFINKLTKLGILKEELDYHFARASMEGRGLPA